MRANRKLAENVWYFVATKVNDREPMFWSKHLIWLFRRVLSELLGFFAVEIRGLRFDGATVSFYIRPDRGLELPKIIKRVRQTFIFEKVWAAIYRFLAESGAVRA
jgi:hypothetical protein